MNSTMLALALALTIGQTSERPFAGTWIAEFKGSTYVRLELSLANGALGGKISLGNIQLDSEGNVNKATSAPSEFTPIFDVLLRDSILSFARKESRDTDRFEMRLLANGAAELRFLLSDDDRKDLAESSGGVPKPFRLTKAVPTPKG
jgi:hypothetical protein